jgi:hypothetical protein
MNLHRPDPILRHTAQPVERSHSPLEAATRLAEGEQLWVSDRYSTGAEILDQLKIVLPPSSSEGFKERRAAKQAYREAALRLLVPISEHRVRLAEARPIGFLEQLYPALNSYHLPFIVIQELHGAWGRYREGTHLSVLGHRLHPYFGTYVPNRTSHLELFGTWMSQYKGPKDRAVDVGTGCGVLALMLSRAGFDRVLATDCNPNAVHSVALDLDRLKVRPTIDLRQGDLLCDMQSQADLIVFNPPWMQGEVNDVLDRALYFEPGLFERFFDQAVDCLQPEGRIVLLFSSLIELVQPDVPHPILTELERGRLKLVNKLQRKVRSSDQAKRRRTREKVEIWELAKA